jgi:hypothetical protein
MTETIVNSSSGYGIFANNINIFSSELYAMNSQDDLENEVIALVALGTLSILNTDIASSQLLIVGPTSLSISSSDYTSTVSNSCITDMNDELFYCVSKSTLNATIDE